MTFIDCQQDMSRLLENQCTYEIHGVLHRLWCLVSFTIWTYLVQNIVLGQRILTKKGQFSCLDIGEHKHLRLIMKFIISTKS